MGTLPPSLPAMDKTDDASMAAVAQAETRHGTDDLQLDAGALFVLQSKGISIDIQIYS